MGGLIGSIIVIALLSSLFSSIYFWIALIVLLLIVIYASFKHSKVNETDSKLLELIPYSKLLANRINKTCDLNIWITSYDKLSATMEQLICLFDSPHTANVYGNPNDDYENVKDNLLNNAESFFERNSKVQPYTKDDIVSRINESVFLSKYMNDKMHALINKYYTEGRNIQPTTSDNNGTITFSRFTETLPDGGVLSIRLDKGKVRWDISYDITPKTIDGNTDLRYNPSRTTIADEKIIKIYKQLEECMPMIDYLLNKGGKNKMSSVTINENTTVSFSNNVAVVSTYGHHILNPHRTLEIYKLAINKAKQYSDLLNKNIMPEDAIVYMTDDNYANK